MSALETVVGRMTLAELARFANTTVERIVAAVMTGAPNGSTRRTSASPRTTAQPAEVVKRGKVPRGGVRVDQVLAIVASAKAPVDAGSIRAKVGGSQAQVRAALQKLAESGKVKITGERRGTRYSAR